MSDVGAVRVSSISNANRAAPVPGLAVLTAASRGLHVWVKGTYQPVERRVVHQVVHGVVQRLAETVQLRAAGGQHAFRQVAKGHRLAEVSTELGGEVRQGEGLVLDVAREPLHARHQPLARGLQLLGQTTGQDQRTRLDDLQGERPQILLHRIKHGS